MSDLGNLEKLARSAAQLPVSAYFDAARYRHEIATLFDTAPRYVGHALMVPEVGDFHTLPQERDGRMLVRKAPDGAVPGSGIALLSNVCRHRQAIIKNGRGNTSNHIVCPLHRWTYGLDGSLVGAPHFADNPCLNLASTRLSIWNGLLFEAGRELTHLPARDVARELGAMHVAMDINPFDFSGYLFDHVELHECAYNWKTFIEVYLEDYHVGPFHPGLGGFVDCSKLGWEFGDWYSVQTVGVNNGLSRPGSETYRKWHEVVMNFRGGEQPAFGAIWFTYYPNIMVEWYPHVLVISTLVPRGAEKCTNIVEYYYPEEIALFEREFIEAGQQAYDETAREDDEICMRMTAGRRALWLEGREEHGPYQSPMEDGMVHFHEFMRRELKKGAGAGAEAEACAREGAAKILL